MKTEFEPDDAHGLSVPCSQRQPGRRSAGTACVPALASSLVLGGCANAPSISVLGAYFPDWMFCIAGAIVLAFLCRRVLTAIGWSDFLGKLTASLLYSALAAIFAFAGWLVFYLN